MPALAAGDRRVIAVDLPDMDGSSKPDSGYDKKSLAAAIHGFVRALGYDQVGIAGHDIGSIVASPPIPGSARYLRSFAFHHAPGLPEKLLAGRTRHVVDWMFDDVLMNLDAVDERDRAIFAQRSDSPEGIEVVVVDAGRCFVDEAPQAVIDEFTNFFD